MRKIKYIDDYENVSIDSKLRDVKLAPNLDKWNKFR